MAQAGSWFDSKVTIKYNPSGKRVSFFSGKVTSEKAACVPDRKVVLFSDDAPGDPTKVGSFQTTAGGAWSVEADFTEPLYFAKVRKREIAAGLCRPDRSKSLYQ